MSAECPLRGRVALVTGAAQGIGRAIALGLAQRGATVAIADLQPDAGERVAAEILGAGGQAIQITTDLRSPADLRAMIDRCVEHYGALDILVNNARPRLRPAPFPDGLEEWDAAQEVLVRAPVFATAYAVEHLAKRQGVVLNIASTNATLVSHQPAAYQVAKAALVQFTRVAAVELGPRGIRVNAICPGLVDIADREAILTSDRIRQQIVEAVVPLGRAATSQEVGDLAALLCSDQAAYLTGQAIFLDGGETLVDQFAAATAAVRRLEGSTDQGRRAAP